MCIEPTCVGHQRFDVHLRGRLLAGTGQRRFNQVVPGTGDLGGGHSLSLLLGVWWSAVCDRRIRLAKRICLPFWPRAVSADIDGLSPRTSGRSGNDKTRKFCVYSFPPKGDTGPCNCPECRWRTAGGAVG